MIDNKAVKRYHKRVDSRLKARGIEFDGYRWDVERADASQRLAFGLCQKYGIELPKGAGPKDAWAALKEKTGKGPMDFYAESGKSGADKIKFSTASPKSFTKALAKAKAAQNPEAGWRVTGLTKQQLLEEHPKAKIHVTDGGSTIAIDDGDIVAVCVGAGDGKGGFQSGTSILEFAVKNGGNKLDSYTGNHNFYVKNGFEPVSWCKWDDDYANDEWLKMNGFTKDQWDAMKVKPKDSELKIPREPIVFYKYVGRGKVQNPKLEDFMSKVPAAEDYFAAQKQRNRDLERKRSV